MKKLDAFQIKVFALVLMLLDHLWFAFPHVFPMWFHPISRVVSPIFAFLLVEGFFHTRDRKKYNLRLWGWAVFMQLGNIAINILLKSKEVSVYISTNFYNCTIEIFRGLALMYIGDERFTKNIDKYGEGLAQFFSDAMNIYCDNNLK